ncbi:GNAT family protein [Patulibacter sp. SYSU D01012]|uniref:GNAT family N-acetyltransferase n=1 Tax=Patulibacter sp. SYSU D01012 TaxID=2817381 RepID=UPI001B31564F
MSVAFAPVELPRPSGGVLLLREATLGDAHAFAALVAGDLDHLGEHLPWAAGAATPEGAAAFLGRYLRREGGRVLVLLLLDGDVVVGGTALLGHDPAADAVEVGCWIATDYEGEGLVRRACLATIAHARRALGAHRLVWTAAAGNARSAALARRLGFRPEGRRRHAAVHRGRRQDLDGFSLIGDEIDAALAG